jgi:hypothetical protein
METKRITFKYTRFYQFFYLYPSVILYFRPYEYSWDGNICIQVSFLCWSVGFRVGYNHKSFDTVY